MDRGQDGEYYNIRQIEVHDSLYRRYLPWIRPFL
jgi:hypothetical protein